MLAIVVYVLCILHYSGFSLQVDILFDDDRGFWSAVYELIVTTKRPIVMTCNGGGVYVYTRVWLSQSRSYSVPFQTQGMNWNVTTRSCSSHAHPWLVLLRETHFHTITL